jgi:hypothetical protein
MEDDINNTIWSTENLVFFGHWLIHRGEYGYGLLCIHGSCLGLKIGTLLNLRWCDFIRNTEYDGNAICEDYLIIDDSKKKTSQHILLSRFMIETTATFFDNHFYKHGISYEDNIYVNSKTKKVLSTTSLNRELNKLYNEFREFILETTLLKLKLRPLKSNAMEIAWARDMVEKYNYTKKVFIHISKYMGHRTVNDTINLLELEPNDNIYIWHNLYNPSYQDSQKMLGMFDKTNDLQKYLSLQSKSMREETIEYRKALIKGLM